MSWSFSVARTRNALEDRKKPLHLPAKADRPVKTRDRQRSANTKLIAPNPNKFR
ncbi:MAG: hypothetical protein HC795_09250 [Coleofasciculaceae cyanobacterium RL_1_1]|nr:hypothetical protein [Coleofasciculaceae cyanobacterium RL_1_1]